MNSGHWIIEVDILNRVHNCRCSICGKDLRDYFEGTEVWWLGKLPNYCPHCGEKMSYVNNIVTKISYLESLYHTLREIKHQNLESFNSNKYKWKLGAEIVNELKMLDEEVVSQEKTLYLFGIEVEIDYKNLRNIRIYEDITQDITIRLYLNR